MLREGHLFVESVIINKGILDERVSDGSVDRIRFPPEADSTKQGKLGPDAGAPRARR